MLAVPPDREKLVAEIAIGSDSPDYGEVQWAEIHQELAGFTLELYPRPDGKPWSSSSMMRLLLLAEHDNY